MNAAGETLDLSRLPEELRQRVPLALERAKVKIETIAPSDAVPRLLNAATKARSVRQRTIWLHSAASAWVQPFMNVVPCRRGCAHCCHLPVAITSGEARLLAEASGRRASEPEQSVEISRLDADPQAIDEATRQMRAQRLRACPFLDTAGSCTVYQARPLACRLHVNLDDDDLLCRLIEGVSVPVPYVDAREMWLLHLSAHANDRLADIREFFPL